MYKYQSMAWMGFAELHVCVHQSGMRARSTTCRRRADIEAARDVYLQAVKNRFDYPEYLFDAWTTFEHQHGSLEEVEHAEAEVQKQMRGINSRRARLAAQAAERQYASAGAEAAPVNGTAKTEAEPKASLKRPAEDTVSESGSGAPDAKRAKTVHEPATKLKRDRENSTVLIGGFPPNAVEDDLRKVFKDVRAHSGYRPGPDK
jgi:hypothetical protein